MSLTFTGITTLLVGLVATIWISIVVLLQPLLAVWFFPAAFAALAATTPAAARNLAVAFTIPFGYLIGGGMIPTLYRNHGRHRLLRPRFHGDGNSDFVRRRLGIVIKVAGKVGRKHADAPVVIDTRAVL